MQITKSELDKALERTRRILTLKQAGGRIIFALGYEFKLVKQDYDSNPQTAYELYGFENFIQFHSQPGIAYSVGSVNRFIRLYSTYVEKLGISEEDPNLKAIDYTVLDQMTKFVTKENIEEWLEKAANLGRRDLALAIRNEDKEEDCEHKIFESFEYKICKECNDVISKEKLKGSNI